MNYKFKSEIKYFVWILGLGLSLVAYAENKFFSRDIGELIIKRLETLEHKLDVLIMQRK